LFGTISVYNQLTFSITRKRYMPKTISEQVRQSVIEAAAKHGFAVQMKDSVQDQYVKNLMFYSKSLNQTIYIRKDRAIDDSGNPAYFHVAVHPNFFNKKWISVQEGIEELINRQKKKNLHSSSNYQKFPLYPENDEPCGMCFKVVGYDALAKLFAHMAATKVDNAISIAEPIVATPSQSVACEISADNTGAAGKSEASERATDSIAKVPTKGLVIKSPYIDRILAGTKTWEMRSSVTQIRGPIALIKQGSGQVVGVANLVDVKGPLTMQDKLNGLDKHQISIDRLESGETEKWNMAWVLEDAQQLSTPVNYQHPNGAVIWVNLDQKVQEKLTLALGFVA
jgi:hypothetical protein